MEPYIVETDQKAQFQKINACKCKEEVQLSSQPFGMFDASAVYYGRRLPYNFLPEASLGCVVSRVKVCTRTRWAREHPHLSMLCKPPRTRANLGAV